MGAVFAHVSQHTAAPGETPSGGRVVLSQIGRGDSAIYCGTPSLKYVLEGEERYEIDGQVHVVTPGRFLLVDAGSKLTAVLPRREQTTGLCVYLPGGEVTPHRALAAALDGPDSRDPFVARALVLSAATAPWGRRLARLAAALARDPAAGPRAAELIARYSARAMGEMLDETSGHLGRLSAEKPSTRLSLLERVERARGYLHDHPTEPVTLDRLAAHAGLSQFHLARTFRAVHGEPVIQYHRRLRLERAARLLASGNVAAEVAERVGFSDAAAFSRAFKRQFGVTPGARAAAGIRKPG